MAVVRWYTYDIAIRIDAERMDLHIKACALKIQYRHIISLQTEPTITNLHADAINDIICMSLNKNLLSATSEFTEKCSQSGLCAWVQMHFRLLP